MKRLSVRVFSVSEYDEFQSAVVCADGVHVHCHMGEFMDPRAEPSQVIGVCDRSCRKTKMDLNALMRSLQPEQNAPFRENVLVRADKAFRALLRTRPNVNVHVKLTHGGKRLEDECVAWCLGDMHVSHSTTTTTRSSDGSKRVRHQLMAYKCHEECRSNLIEMTSYKRRVFRKELRAVIAEYRAAHA